MPVAPITTNILDAANLSLLADNVTSNVAAQWNNIQSALQSTTFIETYLSNYGLLQAFQNLSGSQLDTSDPSRLGVRAPISPQTSVDTVLSRLSWSSMIPAVFHWAPTLPYNLPAADSQTTNLSNQTISLNGPNGQDGPNGAYGVVAGHFFGNDSTLDLAVTNFDDSNISILKGKGDGTFATQWPPTSLNNPNGPTGIAVGRFINNSTNDDLAVADNGSSAQHSHRRRPGQLQSAYRRPRRAQRGA